MMFSYALLWKIGTRKMHVSHKQADPTVVSKLRSMHMFAWIDWEYKSGNLWKIERRTYLAFIACQHLSWLSFLHKRHYIIAILSTIHGAAGRMCINHTKWQADTMHKAMVPSFGSIKLLHVRARFRIYFVSFRFFLHLFSVSLHFCENERYKSSGTYGYDWKFLFIRCRHFIFILLK